MTLLKETEAWHFLKEDRKLQWNHTGDLVVPGRIDEVEPEKLKLCSYGLHASEKALDALQYAPGPIICRVRLSGKILL